MTWKSLASTGLKAIHSPSHNKLIEEEFLAEE